MGFFTSNNLYIISESQLLDIINEEYFKNIKLEKVKNLLHDLREEYKYNETRVNTDTKVKEISLLIEEIFGFKSFQLIIEQSKFPNAFTYPLSSKIDKWNYKKCIRKTNQGLMFTKEAGVNIVAHITSALLFDTKFTDDEIIAILLHEIGHNFSDSIDNTLGIFSNIKKVLAIPSIIVNPKGVSNTLTGSVTKYNDYMRKNYPDLVAGFNSVKLFLGTLNYVCISFNRAMSTIPNFAAQNLINTFNQIIQTAIRNPVGLVMRTVFNFFGKEDEYVSDSFVAMYGYGSSLSSALLKLERHNPTVVDDVFKSTEFGALYYALFVETTDFIRILFSDNHPSTAKRLLNVLDELKQEYDQSYINEKTKKEIKKEITEIENMIKDELENKSFDGNKWRVMWNQYVLANSTKGPKSKMIKELIVKISNIENL